MATTLNSTILSSRYRDDYADSDGYYRILFNSGRALQARELTQMQTIIQEQIKRFGENIFKEGAIVTPGSMVINNAYEFVKLSSSSTLPSNPQILVGTTFTGQSSSVTARVIEVIEATGSDPDTLYVAYTNAPSAQAGAATVRFSASETINNGSITLAVQTTNTNANPAVGRGTRLSVDKGVYFVKGFFVFVEKQSVIISKYTDNPTEIVGFVSAESVQTADDNRFLYDNQGVLPNISAPGADRLRIRLNLKNQSDIAASDNFIPIVSVVDGVIFQTIAGSTDQQYNRIRDFVATRIKENSGDYIVKPFYLNHDADSANTHLLLRLSDGVAVIEGYRADHYAPETYRIPKATDTSVIDNEVVAAGYGNYVLVDASTIGNVNGLPNISTLEKLNIRDGAGYGGSTIGTCRVRAVSEDTGYFYRFYLFDIEMNAGKTFRSAQSIGTSSSFYFNPYRPSGQTVLYDVDKNTSLFPLKLTRPQSFSDIVLTTQRRFTVSTNGVGAGSISLSASGETFANINDWVAAKSDSDIITGGLTFSSNPAGQIAANFTNLPASSTVHVYAYVNQSAGSVRNKTLNNVTITANVVGGEVNLGKADIYRVTRVTENDSDGRDMTQYFSFDNGQRDNYYALGKLRLRGGYAAPTNPIFVRYEYFSHGVSGDFFAASSYTGQVDYGDIPSFRTSTGTRVNLINVLDFRSVQDSDGAFANSSTGARIHELPQVNDTIRSDITYYLGRVDTVGLDKNGQVVIARGPSSFAPKNPTLPTGVLPLYDVRYAPNTINERDLSVRKYNHKRYTMKDIGKLEQRIDNIEELTTLSLTELDTKNFKVLDSAGNDRTKSGFFVDNFSTQLFSDVNNYNYRAAIDPQKRYLRPAGVERNVRMIYDSSQSSNVILKGDNVYLTHTQETYFDQSSATRAINVNPFEAVIYRGDVELSPASDEWREVKVITTKSVDGGTKLNTTQAYLWNNWEWNWGGTNIQDLKVGSTTNIKDEGTYEYVNKVVSEETITEVIGEVVLDVALIPWIRARKVYFKAQGLRPSSRVWAYFDQVRMDDWVREETFTRIANDPNDHWNEHATATSHPDGNTALITDADGNVEGSLWIPNTADRRFRAGVREFTILDVSSYNKQGSGTIGMALYAAQGRIEDVDQTVKSTRQLNVEYYKFDTSTYTAYDEGGDTVTGAGTIIADWNLTSSAVASGSNNSWNSDNDAGHGDDPMGGDFGSGGDFAAPVCLTENMKVMIDGHLKNVTEVNIGDNIDSTVVTDVIHKHMRNGYYVINNELEITNDHPVYVNGVWKRTDELEIGDCINEIQVTDIKYVQKVTPTVYIETESEGYNVYCGDNTYTVSGKYGQELKNVVRKLSA